MGRMKGRHLLLDARIVEDVHNAELTLGPIGTNPARLQFVFQGATVYSFLMGRSKES